MAILWIVIQLGFGGFDEDPNDPYHDEHYWDHTKKPMKDVWSILN